MKRLPRSAGNLARRGSAVQHVERRSGVCSAMPLRWSRSRRSRAPCRRPGCVRPASTRATAAKTIWAMRAPRRDDEGIVAEIDQQHLDLAAIVAVDGARRVEARDAVVEGEARSAAAPGPRSLRGISSTSPVGTSARLPGRISMRPVVGNGGAQIEAGGAGGFIGRQRQALGMRQAHDADRRGLLSETIFMKPSVSDRDPKKVNRRSGLFNGFRQARPSSP